MLPITIEGKSVQMTRLPKSELCKESRQKKIPDPSGSYHLLVMFGVFMSPAARRGLLLDALGIFFDLVELRIIDLRSIRDGDPWTQWTRGK